MRGDCSEAVLKQQMKMLRDIRKQIETLTTMEDRGKKVAAPGAPTKDQILQVCREYPMLANYHEKCFEQLKDKLDTDSPGDEPVNWKKLFVSAGHSTPTHVHRFQSSLLPDGWPLLDGMCESRLSTDCCCSWVALHRKKTRTGTSTHLSSAYVTLS